MITSRYFERLVNFFIIGIATLKNINIVCLTLLLYESFSQVVDNQTLHNIYKNSKLNLMLQTVFLYFAAVHVNMPARFAMLPELKY